MIKSIHLVLANLKNLIVELNELLIKSNLVKSLKEIRDSAYQGFKWIDDSLVRDIIQLNIFKPN